MKKITLKPEDWRESHKFQFVAYPFFSSAYHASASGQKAPYRGDWYPFINAFNDGHLICYLPKSSLHAAGQRALSECLRGGRDYINDLERVSKEADAAIAICRKVATDSKIHIQQWWPKVQKPLSEMSRVIFPFDYALNDFLMELQIKDPDLAARISSNIVSPVPSFIFQANLFLKKVIKRFPADSNRVYNEFIKKFGWFQNTYAGKFRITENWLAKYIATMPAATGKNTIMSIPAKYQVLAEAASAGVAFRDKKKMFLLLAVDQLELWLKKYCKSQGLSFDDLKWLSAGEVISGDNKFRRKAKEYQIKKRRVGIMNPDGMNFDDISEAFYKQVEKLQLDKNKLIKGLVANSGLIIGRVKVVLDPIRDAKKLKAGDILVTSMTRPEFLPLMKKAAAFVTDEGGLTCHAAIIAREMNKPCLIATKNATQLLKDGDLVEVDANKGNIKIIKN